jgi:hypothetical protein
VNDGSLEICLTGAGDDKAVRRAFAIMEELRKRDREAGRQRLGEFAGGCWLFEFGMTDLEQEAARQEVERELTDIEDDALKVLDVRPPPAPPPR